MLSITPRAHWRDRRELNPHRQYGKLEYLPLYYYPIGPRIFSEERGTSPQYLWNWP